MGTESSLERRSLPPSSGEGQKAAPCCLRLWLPLSQEARHCCRLTSPLREAQAGKWHRIESPGIDQPHTGIWSVIKAASQISEGSRLCRKVGLRQLGATWGSWDPLSPQACARMRSKHSRNLNVKKKKKVKLQAVLEEFNLRTGQAFPSVTPNAETIQGETDKSDHMQTETPARH